MLVNDNSVILRVRKTYHRSYSTIRPLTDNSETYANSQGIRYHL